jgi:hypothetical protein
MATALTANLNRRVVPVDITQAEMYDVARPKTQTGQQQQDRPIPPADSGGSIAGSDQALHIFWWKVAWQRSQTPMSHNGDGSIQPDSASALGDQKTQEHAKCVGTILSRPPPARTTFRENKCSQSAGIKAAWILSKLLEQLPNVNAISTEGHITDTPLLMHPLTEGRQQSGIVNRRVDRRQSDDPGISQVGQEQARTTDYAQLILMGVV